MRILICFITLSLIRVECCAQTQQAANGVSGRAGYLVQLAEKKVSSAESLLRRGAIWSSRSHCLEAMQLLVSSEDGKSQDNTRTTNLSLGLQCLREAEDFVVGLRDAASLRRVIESHETPVLKDNLESVVSAVSAHQAYLRFARTCFQESLGDVAIASLGSKATFLYGRSILRAKDVHEWHALAVVETLYGIAISIDADNATAHQELGVLMLEAGDEKTATRHLVRSATLAPTRRGYQHLRKAALAENLPKVVAICEARLRGGDYLPGIKVRSMSPAEFAATHNAFPQAAAVKHDLAKTASQQQSAKSTTKSTNEERSTERMTTRRTLKKLLGLAR